MARLPLGEISSTVRVRIPKLSSVERSRRRVMRKEAKKERNRRYMRAKRAAERAAGLTVHRAAIRRLYAHEKKHTQINGVQGLQAVQRARVGSEYLVPDHVTRSVSQATLMGKLDGFYIVSRTIVGDNRSCSLLATRTLYRL